MYESMRVSPTRLMMGVLVACVLALGCVAAAHAVEAEYLLVGPSVVRLRGKLPEAWQLPPARRVKVEQWDQQRVAGLWGSVASTVGSDAAGSGATGEKSIPVADGGLVRLTLERDGLYFSGHSPYGRARPAASCNASAAIEIARRYIDTHGGMPADAELWSIRDVLVADLAFSADGSGESGAEKSETVGRYVEFRHRVAGLEVDGPDGGDRIKVRVDTQGAVHAYGRAWTKAEDPVGPGRRIGVSPRTALGKAIADGGSSKSKLQGSIELKDARLVYVRSSSDSADSELRPAWRFVVDGGAGAQELFVDAFEGEVLDER